MNKIFGTLCATALALSVTGCSDTKKAADRLPYYYSIERILPRDRRGVISFACAISFISSSISFPPYLSTVD